MELLDIIKQKLRISGSDIDDDVQQNIQTCLAELSRMGIDIPDDVTVSPLIVKAIELYVKWQWDYLNDGDRYAKNFADLRNALSLTNKYLEDFKNGNE